VAGNLCIIARALRKMRWSHLASCMAVSLGDWTGDDAPQALQQKVFLLQLAWQLWLGCSVARGSQHSIFRPHNVPSAP
jgi:hypothetical protein